MIGLIEWLYEMCTAFILIEFLTEQNWGLMYTLLIYAGYLYGWRTTILYFKYNYSTWEALHPKYRQEYWAPDLNQKLNILWNTKPINIYSESIIVNPNIWSHDINIVFI